MIQWCLLPPAHVHLPIRVHSRLIMEISMVSRSTTVRVCSVSHHLQRKNRAALVPSMNNLEAADFINLWKSYLIAALRSQHSFLLTIGAVSPSPLCQYRRMRTCERWDRSRNWCPPRAMGYRSSVRTFLCLMYFIFSSIFQWIKRRSSDYGCARRDSAYTNICKMGRHCVDKRQFKGGQRAWTEDNWKCVSDQTAAIVHCALSSKNYRKCTSSSHWKAYYPQGVYESISSVLDIAIGLLTATIFIALIFVKSR